MWELESRSRRGDRSCEGEQGRVTVSIVMRAGWPQLLITYMKVTSQSALYGHTYTVKILRACPLMSVVAVMLRTRPQVNLGDGGSDCVERHGGQLFARCAQDRVHDP